MYSIFHEKQEGFLCAQHCLNALLQNNYFNAVDLASLAIQLDEEERLALSREGTQVNSDSGHRSNNMDDSGYFSIQVICKALAVWGLELVSVQSQDIISPEILSEKNAFICHFRQHWLTIRRFGHQWFNLNSLLSGPQLLTETYLCLYLTQLRQEGYSIFVVLGDLPACEADEILMSNPIDQLSFPQAPGSSVLQKSVNNEIHSDNEDWMLQQAIADSIKHAENNDPTLSKILIDSWEETFEKNLASAISMSLENNPDNQDVAVEFVPHSREAIRANRQKFLDNLEKDCP